MKPTAITASPVADRDIRAIAEAAERWRDPEHPARAEAVARTLALPNTFTPEAVAFAVNQQVALLTEEALRAWVGGRYRGSSSRVAVVGPGNIPFADLQDWLAVVLSGHAYFGALSSRSPFLLPAFAAETEARGCRRVSRFGALEDGAPDYEAVIASGHAETMANMAAWCDRLGIPSARRLLRGHRYAVAVLDGRESADELEGLAEDALLHEGRGCRNVAVIWAPAAYSPDGFLDALAAFRGVFPAHPKTVASLKMPQAMLEALGLPHAYGDDLSFVLSKGGPEPREPGHLRWSEYEALDTVAEWLVRHTGELQLLVAAPRVSQRLPAPIEVVLPGWAQRPALDWRPDGVDTMAFLAQIGRSAEPRRAPEV